MATVILGSESEQLTWQAGAVRIRRRFGTLGLGERLLRSREISLPSSLSEALKLLNLPARAKFL